MTRLSKILSRGFGIAIILIVGAAGAFAPWLGTVDPNASSADILAASSAAHWLGTDDLGRDIYSRVLYGARISLVIGPSAALVALAIGAPVGLVAGYSRGKIDMLLVQGIDVFIAMPGLIIALMITVMVGATAQNLVLVLGFVMWPEMARIVRSLVIGLRDVFFVEAARSMGCSVFQLLTIHILPNIMRTIASQFAILVSSAIFTAASLGFLGLGLPPPAADWGTMVQTGFDYLSLNPLLSLAPGAAVAFTVLGFYLVGQAVD